MTREYYFIDEDRMKLRFPVYENGRFKRFSWSDFLVGKKVHSGKDIMGKPEQCTGRMDKDGRLIYEHDIIRCQYKTEFCAGVVVWDKEDASFSILVKDELFSFLQRNDDDTVEVLGNIHEDKELLND